MGLPNPRTPLLGSPRAQLTYFERHSTACFDFLMAQSTVTGPNGGQGNVLSDYKETVPEKNLQFLHSHCNRVTDMLIILCHNHIPLALLKCKHVRCLSIFTTTFSTFSPSVESRKMGKITTLTTIYIACVITLQVYLSTESTCMSA